MCDFFLTVHRKGYNIVSVKFLKGEKKKNPIRMYDSNDILSKRGRSIYRKIEEKVFKRPFLAWESIRNKTIERVKKDDHYGTIYRAGSIANAAHTPPSAGLPPATRDSQIRRPRATHSSRCSVFQPKNVKESAE